MSDGVYLCLECGQRNRLPTGANRRTAKCGKCHALLFLDGRPRSAQFGSGASPLRTNEQGSGSTVPPSRKGGSSAVLIGLFLAAIMLCGIWFSLKVNNSPSASGVQQSFQPTPRATPPAQKEVDLPPAVARPQPGVLSNWTNRKSQAPFEILTPYGADYFIKLVDTVSGHDAMAIYVHGGQRLEIDVPLGSYRMRYASGSTWRGTMYFFGPGDLTNYSEAQTILRFEISDGYIKGHSVELILQQGGNLSTRRLHASDF